MLPTLTHKRPESFQPTKQQVYRTRHHRASDARRGGHRHDADFKRKLSISRQEYDSTPNQTKLA